MPINKNLIYTKCQQRLAKKGTMALAYVEAQEFEIFLL